MSKVDDGGPAFPDPARAGGHCMDVGMSLRDWFAGQALAGLLAHPKCGDVGPTEEHRTNLAVSEAYYVADAMIAERKKGGDA